MCQLGQAKRKCEYNYDVVHTVMSQVYIISSHAGYNETPCDYGLQRCGGICIILHVP